MSFSLEFSSLEKKNIVKCNELILSLSVISFIYYIFIYLLAIKTLKLALKLEGIRRLGFHGIPRTRAKEDWF